MEKRSAFRRMQTSAQPESYQCPTTTAIAFRVERISTSSIYSTARGGVFI